MLLSLRRGRLLPPLHSLCRPLSSGPAVSLQVTLFQYATCPFCNRVKSYLDFMRVSYQAVEVNPLSKKQLKSLQLSTGEVPKQVPVAVVQSTTLSEEDKEENRVVLSDSSAIIQHIHQQLTSSSAPGGTTPELSDDFLSEKSQEWSVWSETKLAVLLYPNITRTFGASWAAFAYVNSVKDWSFMEKLSNRVLGPVAMYAVRNKIKKKYGIEDEQGELLTLLTEWTNAISNAKSKSNNSSVKFLNGCNISHADLMVFGVLRGIAGLPAHTVIMSDNKVLKEWYDEVERTISEPLH